MAQKLSSLLPVKPFLLYSCLYSEDLYLLICIKSLQTCIVITSQCWMVSRSSNLSINLLRLSKVQNKTGCGIFLQI